MFQEDKAQSLQTVQMGTTELSRRARCVNQVRYETWRSGGQWRIRQIYQLGQSTGCQVGLDLQVGYGTLRIVWWILCCQAECTAHPIGTHNLILTNNCLIGLKAHLIGWEPFPELKTQPNTAD